MPFRGYQLWPWNVKYTAFVNCSLLVKKLTVVYCQVSSMMVGLEAGDELHTLSVALLINLALHNRCASQLLEGNNLQYLIECAFHHQSSIIMKILRNASTHPNTKLHFIVSHIYTYSIIFTMLLWIFPIQEKWIVLYKYGIQYLIF